MELAVVMSFDTEARALTLLLFQHLKLPVREITLPVTEPDRMIGQLEADVPEAAGLSTRMRTQLIAMFHESLNSLVTGNPEATEIELLVVALGSDLDISTLYQSRDRKLIRIRQLARAMAPTGKPRFVHLLYEKLLRCEPDAEILAEYVRYCLKRDEGDRLTPWVSVAITLPSVAEDTLVMLAGVAIRHHQYDAAESLCDRVLQTNYGNVHALLGKAQCRYQQGEPDFLSFIRKAFQFNKRITVETVTERFEFRKRTRTDVFDVISLKDAMVEADIPPDALKRKELLSIPWRTETIQGSIYFVRAELAAWKAAMEVMNVASGRFGPAGQ